MKKVIDWVTIKFLIVGVINTLVGSAVMFLLYNGFRTGYWIASACNYIIGSIVSYFLNKHFTFRSKEKSLREVITFAVNIVICYVLAYGIAKPAKCAKYAKQAKAAKSLSWSRLSGNQFFEQ